MASSFRISIDLGAVIPTGSALTAEAFPTLSYAVKSVSEAAHGQWVAWASGAPMPNGMTISNRTGEYARSIMLKSDGDFSAEVYTDLAYARVIEDGAAARDMKKMLDSSLKVRLTHDGRRYLIIPFRHNAPNSVMGNSMPQAVHDWWGQARTPSAITGTYRRVSGTGAYDVKTRERLTVPGWKYKWGTRLGQGDLEGMGITGRTAKRLEGMVQFRKPGGSGGSSHSQFITFRTMMEGSKGWVVPAQPGKHPAEQVAKQYQPIAEQAFKTAVEEDVAAVLAGG